MLAVLFLILVVGSMGCDDPKNDERHQWKISSPDGRIAIEIAQLSPSPSLGRPASLAAADPEAPSAEPGAVRLYYRVLRGNTDVLLWSPLGLRTMEQEFVDRLRFYAETTHTISEAYSAPYGKRRNRAVRANEMVLHFANPAGAELAIDIRASNDGIAFRYRILGRGTATMGAEESGYRLPVAARTWMLPYDRGTPFTPAYERFFEPSPAGTKSDQLGWGLAALFQVPDSDVFGLIAEASLDSSYAGTHLEQPVETLYRVALPDDGEGQGTGDALPRSRLPWTLPWRVLHVGSLSEIFASTLVDDLSPPPPVPVGQLQWIQPGRSSWSWFSQGTGDLLLQRQYVDFAAEMGWEYTLVDAHWDEWTGGNRDIDELLAYAAERNVGIFLWYNSGGPHNIVPEPPRDRMHVAEIRRAEMARIAALGVRGIKVDFFQSEKQDRIQQYVDILRDALDARLLVNFHGSTLPRGWQRTYPNLVSMEGVLGAEYYKFFEGDDAIHNVRLVFTRNVVGSMDYTPVTFEAAYAKRGIPYSHQVALAIAFESGVQHFAERADANPSAGFRAVFARAPEVKEFFRNIPVAWDDSKLLEGSPDSHVVLARRSGESWYVAGLNGLSEPISLRLDLASLDSRAKAATLLVSGTDPTELASQRVAVDEGTPLTLTLGAKAGFVAILR